MLTNCRLFNLGMVNLQPKTLARNIGATPVSRPSLVPIIQKLMYEPLLGRNRTSATAVIRSFQTNLLSIILRHTRNVSQSARSLVIRVENPFRTAPVLRLMSAPRINNNKQKTVNPALRPLMTLWLRKEPGSLLILVLDQLPLKHPLQLQVPVGKRIQFTFRPTLFQALTKMLLRRTGNTGHKSPPVSVARTDCKIGIIFASQPSTQPTSANNWAGYSPISLPCLKSTSLLVLFRETQKLAICSTITPLPTTISFWNNRFWSPVTKIWSPCIDFLEWVRQQRPNSKWVMDLV